MNAPATRTHAPSTNQGKGSSAGSANLNIPKLGDMPAKTLEQFASAPAVIQDGEDPQAMGSGNVTADDMDAIGISPFPGVKTASAVGHPGEPLHRPETLADLQANVDAAARRAANNPVTPRYFGHGEMHTPNIPPEQVHIPASGDLDKVLKRDDLEIEPVDTPMFRDRAEMEAFMREFVVIRIHASPIPGDENPVPLSVNGRQIFVWREEDTAVRRMYVEQLMRAKPVQIRTEQKRTDSGDIRNIVHKTTSMRYPFAIVRDDNPRGRPWANRIMQER